MSTVAIGAFDGRRLLRSPGLWIAAGLFTALVVVGVALPALVLESPEPSTGTAALLGPAVDLVLPTIVIVLTFASVAGPLADGRIKVFLGTPIRRRDVLTGIVLARLVAAWAIVLLSLLVGLSAVIGIYGVPPIGRVVGFTAITMFATASYVAIGVGVSAVTRSSIRAVAALIGGFVVANSLWDPLCQGVYYLLRGDFPGSDPPRWFEVLVLASPLEAYTTAANGILPPSPHLDIAIGDGGASADAGAFVGGDIAATDLVLALLVTALWGAGCLLAGYRAIDRAEID